jgi:flagellar hook protein FlgE
MAFLRSLSAGVTGLRNHTMMMDVIGNNVANINTIGFKGSRITFGEMFAQTLRGASSGTAVQRRHESGADRSRSIRPFRRHDLQTRRYRIDRR